jgi:hypothetical protein
MARSSLGMLSMMATLRARVHNGRLVLDEPTDLPEGEIVELVALEDSVLSAEEETGLAAALESVRVGRVLDHGTAIDHLRARARR